MPERKFGGLQGFFAWLQRRKYKMHIRVFLSRWRSYRPCPACRGARLRPEALATRVAGVNIAELCAMKIGAAAELLRSAAWTPWEAQVGRMILDQVRARLGYLEAVGLVDDHLVGDRIDLGHPRLAAVEQVDRLGHHGQRAGVRRSQRASATPQLFDPGLEVCHGSRR